MIEITSGELNAKKIFSLVILKCLVSAGGCASCCDTEKSEPRREARESQDSRKTRNPSVSEVPTASGRQWALQKRCLRERRRKRRSGIWRNKKRRRKRVKERRGREAGKERESSA